MIMYDEKQTDKEQHKKTAWLIVNEFLTSGKFSEINQWLLIAAGKRAIGIEIFTNAECLALIDTITMEGPFHPKRSLPDFILFWDKDIRLAKYFETLGVPIFNSAQAIENCDDKRLTHILLRKTGIPMPKTILAPFTYANIGYKNLNFLLEMEQELSFPMVLKEAYGSFGEQVYLIHSHEELVAKVQEINPKPFLLQEFITLHAGSDVRLQVVGDKVVACMLRYSVTGDFRANITMGGQMEPYTPSKEQVEMALKAAHALSLDFCGVDLLFGDQEEPILCEVNSNAHFKNIYDCTGINVAEAIMDYILEHLSKA